MSIDYLKKKLHLLEQRITKLENSSPTVPNSVLSENTGEFTHFNPENKALMLLVLSKRKNNLDKLQCIKEVREAFGCGLFEAKNFVDELEALCLKHFN